MGKTEHLKPHQFKPGQSGNPAGKPKDPIPNALKKLTGQQVRRIVKATVKGNIPELQRIVNDHKSSALEVAMASCLITAVKKGDYDTIEKMLLRTGTISKIPDKIEVKGHTINTNLNTEIDAETDDKIAERIARIRASVR